MKKVILISLMVFGLDIVSKQLIIHLLNVDESIRIVKNFFSITYAKNTGVAFSLLDGKVSFIVIMTLFVVFFLFKYVINHVNSKLEIIAYSFVIGGALGNLFDRIIYGYVIDFLDFYIFGYNYPIFNLADSFIVIGIFLLLFKSIKERGRE